MFTSSWRKFEKGENIKVISNKRCFQQKESHSREITKQVFGGKHRHHSTDAVNDSTSRMRHARFDSVALFGENPCYMVYGNKREKATKNSKCPDQACFRIILFTT